MDSVDDEAEHRFWEQASTFLEHPDVSRSTMMGLPCLRVHGAFFASFDRRTGDLLVKLPEARVDALVAAEVAHSFTPAGRRFRQWAAIDPADESTWPGLIAEAFTHVARLPPPRPRRSRTPELIGVAKVVRTSGEPMAPVRRSPYPRLAWPGFIVRRSPPPKRP